MIDFSFSSIFLLRRLKFISHPINNSCLSHPSMCFVCSDILRIHIVWTNTLSPEVQYSIRICVYVQVRLTSYNKLRLFRMPKVKRKRENKQLQWRTMTRPSRTQNLFVLMYRQLIINGSTNALTILRFSKLC